MCQGNVVVGSEPGPVMVQKTAYCETHTPPDCERPRPFSGAEEHRRLQAKRRSSVPVISIPTIPPDKLVAVHPSHPLCAIM